MDSFEQRRNEYFNRLKENVIIVEQIINNSNSEKHENIKMLETLLMPKTDQELKFNYLMIDFMSDIMSLVDDIVSDNVKDIDLSNCILVKFLVKIIKALKIEDNAKIEEYQKDLDSLNNPKKSAKLYYELIIAFGCNPDETVNNILTETGFDTNDELSLLQFQMYLNKANEIIKSKQSAKIDANNSEYLDFFSEFTKEFNKLYKSGIKNDQNKIKNL